MLSCLTASRVGWWYCTVLDIVGMEVRIPVTAAELRTLHFLVESQQSLQQASRRLGERGEPVSQLFWFDHCKYEKIWKILRKIKV